MRLNLFLQVQDLLEQPIGLALYAFQDGNISNVCVQGGGPSRLLSATSQLGVQDKHDDPRW